MELVERLPEPAAIENLRRLGFTTLLLNKRSAYYTMVVKLKIASGPGERLQLLLENDMLAAFDLDSYGSEKE